MGTSLRNQAAGTLVRGILFRIGHVSECSLKMQTTLEATWNNAASRAAWVPGVRKRLEDTLRLGRLR